MGKLNKEQVQGVINLAAELSQSCLDFVNDKEYQGTAKDYPPFKNKLAQLKRYLEVINVPEGNL